MDHIHSFHSWSIFFFTPLTRKNAPLIYIYGFPVWNGLDLKGRKNCPSHMKSISLWDILTVGTGDNYLSVVSRIKSLPFLDPCLEFVVELEVQFMFHLDETSLVEEVRVCLCSTKLPELFFAWFTFSPY